MSLRRRSRRVWRRARLRRFHFAVLLTIVVVAYAGVPHVTRIVDSLGGYNPTGPAHYEPKDSERQGWLQRAAESDTLLATIPWTTVLHITLFLLVAVVWLTLVPTRTARRPPPR
jgi:hypothetical protein